MSSNTQSTRGRYAIVGAGPAGLVAARAFLRRGLEVDIFERHEAIGGIWNIEQSGSPMYRSCNFISSRDYGGFIGYPMPAEYPLYPRWDQIRSYIRSFAHDFGIDSHTHLNTRVVRADPVDKAGERHWRITLESGKCYDYKGVVVASGSQWQPFMPSIPGIETFPGRVIHSSQYTDPSEFEGRRVLVVGAGNSGVDIVVDAAFHGREAYLSTRRGYWFLPKVLFGHAVPDVLAGHINFPVGSRLHGLTREALTDAVFETVGDITEFGLPAPDHPFGASHPIINNQVLHCLAHGILEHRPDVQSVEGSMVQFVNGKSVLVDMIVFATGYDALIPWLPPGVLNYHDGHPQTLLGTLVPEQRGLYLAGSLHFAEHTFSMFDRLIQLAAADAHAETTGEKIELIRELRERFHPDLTGGFPFLHTRRNANQIHVPALEEAFKSLEQEYDIAIPKYLDKDFYLAGSNA